MRIITKRIRVIQMTPEEHATFLHTIEETRKGTTANYAETPLSDGTYLGVSIMSDSDDVPNRVMEKRMKVKKQRNLIGHKY